MKLTKQHREDFVQAVMADVPRIDYKTQVEDLVRKLWREILKKEKLTDISEARLNRENVIVRYYTHDSTNKAVPEIPEGERHWNYTSQVFCSLRLHGLTEEEANFNKHPEIGELLKKLVDQVNQRHEMSKRIRAVIDACSTLKQAKEALPEFEKYLPKEPEKVDRSLPVVGNLVAELTKAGWPDKKKTGTKK